MNDSEAEGSCPVDTLANKRSKTSTEREESSGLIPYDLIVEIFLRLPAKSIARYRCVSKRWASLLRLPYFTELFLIRSSSRPKLLFACVKDSHVFFFSSQQPQSLSPLTTSYYRMKLPYQRPDNSFVVRYSTIRSLVFLRVAPHSRGHEDVSVICNPSTGQSLILPKVKTRSEAEARSYFGYDPVEKQYKVLSMTCVRWLVPNAHQVLTLGGKELSWRKIKCSIPYTIDHTYQHICINGVLYYTAQKHTGTFIIVCFDVRSEKFSFVTSTYIFSPMFQRSLLINYNGKLASLGHDVNIKGSCRNIQLLVLEDVEKQVWSQHIYVLPHVWKNMVGDTFARFVGVTRTNEIVLSSFTTSMSFLLQYGEKHNRQS